VSNGPGRPPRYGEAVALLVAALVVTGLLLSHLVSIVPGAPVEIGTGATVRVDHAALTIFSSRPGAAADGCLVTDGEGRPIELAPRTGERIEVAGRSWFVLARSARPAPAGEYVVNCADSLVSTSYAVGRYESVLGFVLVLFAVVAAAGITLILAVWCAGRVRPVTLRLRNHLFRTISDS